MFTIWDIETGNIVGEYPTYLAALKTVLDMHAANPQCRVGEFIIVDEREIERAINDD